MGKEDFVVYFANVTSWSLKAEEYIRKNHTGSSVVMIAEHHMNGDRMKRARRRLQRRWKVAITPAHSTSKTGTSGGTLVLASSALVAHSSFFGLDGQRLQCDNWTATVVRMKGYDVLFISVYM